ncbi:hypothetical protein D3C72_1744580 [compost metagenome]
MVVAADCGVFFENFGFPGGFHILFNRHQTFFAGFLQDVIEHRHQLHVPRLRVLGALERHGDRGHGGFEHLGLVVHNKRTEGATHDGDDFKRQRRQDHLDVSAVKDIHAEDASEADDVTNDDEHAFDGLGGCRGKKERDGGVRGQRGLPKVTANVSD